MLPSLPNTGDEMWALGSGAEQYFGLGLSSPGLQTHWCFCSPAQEAFCFPARHCSPAGTRSSPALSKQRPGRAGRMSGKHSWKISLLPALGGEDTPVNQRGLWSFPSLPQALHFCQGTAEGDTPQTSDPFSLQLQS